MNVASAARGYTVGNSSFFRYILRLAEMALPPSLADQEAVEILAAVPHALGPEEVAFVSGRGWRVVPAQGELDWPVLEATPERLRSALERARGILWVNAARFQVTGRANRRDEEEPDAVDRRDHARPSRPRRRKRFVRHLAGAA